MRPHQSIVIGFATVFVLCGAQGGCNEPEPTSVSIEQASQNLQMQQMLRNQPVPSFDFSLERHMLTEIYTARQRAVNTFSVVQSEYTGKVLWSCPSIGYPLPYATQLTNPLQVIRKYNGSDHDGYGVVAQQEPNGLYSPGQSDGTWVPCVNDKGQITPVYEEKHVSVFLQPMIEQNGSLAPKPGSAASMTISPHGD